MHRAVQFYNEYAGRALEVGNKEVLVALNLFVHKWVLPAKLAAVFLPVAQLFPQEFFGVSLFLSQLPAKSGNA